MAHDLPDGAQLQLGAVDAPGPLRFSVGAEPVEDRLVERGEVVARDRLAGGDGDLRPPVTVSTPPRTAQ